MKLTLTLNQFLALYKLYQTVVLFDKDHEDMYDALVHAIQLRIWIKLHNKVAEAKPKYKVALSQEEAIAFYIYWSNHQYSIASFEGNLLNNLIAKIDQQYA